MDEVKCQWGGLVEVARGFGPDGVQPPARGEWGEQFVSRVGGVGHNMFCEETPLHVQRYLM